MRAVSIVQIGDTVWLNTSTSLPRDFLLANELEGKNPNIVLMDIQIGHPAFDYLRPLCLQTRIE